MKKKALTVVSIIFLLLFVFLWLRYGPDSWEVQITGVTGDGREIQYRIETVYVDSSRALIFRNEDAGFLPPYFKFDSADLQADASRIARNCSDVPVKVRGYSMRIAWLSMFPNATSIKAPERCLRAPSSSPDQ